MQLDPTQGAPEDASAEDIIQRSLRVVREHLGLPVGYLSEFDEDGIVFRVVDAPGLEHLAAPGTRMQMDQVYCGYVRDGHLPELIRDTSEHETCQSLAVTKDVPIGSHVSVPVRRSDGSVYGMFCCLGPEPNPTLTDRDLSIVRAFADLVGEQVNGALAAREAEDAMRARVSGIMNGHGLRIVHQPICEMRSGAPVGYEALSRFDGPKGQSPQTCFLEASSVGLRVDLELAAIDAAVATFTTVPGGAYLSLNAGPAVVASGRLADHLKDVPPDRIVLEITEHDVIRDGGDLLRELSGLRDNGLRLAVDDTGAGYAGLSLIATLSPDVLKLDMSLTRGVESNAAQRALIAAMVHFGRDTGATLVAEGVETQAERDALIGLGVPFGQGYLFGRPAVPGAQLAEVAAAC